MAISSAVYPTAVHSPKSYTYSPRRRSGWSTEGRFTVRYSTGQFAAARGGVRNHERSGRKCLPAGTRRLRGIIRRTSVYWGMSPGGCARAQSDLAGRSAGKKSGRAERGHGRDSTRPSSGERRFVKSGARNGLANLPTLALVGVRDTPSLGTFRATSFMICVDRRGAPISRGDYRRAAPSSCATPSLCLLFQPTADRGRAALRRHFARLCRRAIHQSPGSHLSSHQLRERGL